MFIGLDLGTTNIKALLVAPDGGVRGRASAPVGLIHTPDGGVEQDVEEIWSATLDALSALGRSADLSGVRAVGVSSQGGALQVVDADYRPVGPTISWLDGRGAPYDEEFTAEVGADWLVEHIGHGRSGIGIGQVLRLRQKRPHLLRAPNRVAFVGDVVVSRLCGRAAHDGTSLSLGWLYNPGLGRADPEALDRLGLDEARLPDLLGVREPAGGLLGNVAEHAALPAGIPVSAAVHDQYAASLGAGVLHSGDVMFGAGTAWVLLAATDRLMPPVIPSALVCTHFVEGLYGQMLSLANGGSAFKWATDLLGIQKRTPAELDEVMETVPPGCDGLRFRPLLVKSGGAGLTAGTDARLTGLRLSHKAGHLLRATVEGLAMELGRYLCFLTGHGVPVTRLVMTGGAAASRVTPQVVSDVTGLPVVCTTETEISALGAAMLARGLVEQQAELMHIARTMAPGTRDVAPGPVGETYRKMFEVYTSFLPAAGT